MHEHRDDIGARLGMWLFLFTEILLFGGLFVLYAVYLRRYQPQFHAASTELSVIFGTVNTVILITSSAFIAWGITALKQGKTKAAQHWTVLTILFGGAFLVNKYFEWGAKFHHGIIPGSDSLATRPEGEQIFFALYYTMTGLHGIHIIIGMAVLAWVWFKLRSGTVNPDRNVSMENAGLYWHLVDLIWIYLFPLFYLIT